MESQVGRVVVAYDGSEPSGAAVDWAATEAERSGRSLTVLHVVDYWSLVPGPVVLAPWPDLQASGFARIAREGAGRARRLAGSVEIRALTQTGRVAPTVISVSSAADLIVVGTRGHGELTGMVLGSVAFAVSAHAPGPVVVVRGDSSLRAGPECPVVVGVDGSTGSTAALRYAAHTAARAQAPLIVVTAYRPLSVQSLPEAMSHGYGGDDPPAPTAQGEGHRIAAKVAADAAAAARQLHSQLDVRQQVLLGPAVGQLCTIAHRAGLLVVGSRGHGGFAGLRLGSVGHGVIHDSPCPVAIVHGRSLPPAAATNQTTGEPVSTAQTAGGTR
jgi:nucleotide-binding universal stress UspA family protein